jgi:hypothetical protein
LSVKAKKSYTRCDESAPKNKNIGQRAGSAATRLWHSKGKNYLIQRLSALECAKARQSRQMKKSNGGRMA